MDTALCNSVWFRIPMEVDYSWSGSSPTRPLLCSIVSMPSLLSIWAAALPSPFCSEIPRSFFFMGAMLCATSSQKIGPHKNNTHNANKTLLKCCTLWGNWNEKVSAERGPMICLLPWGFDLLVSCVAILRNFLGDPIDKNLTNVPKITSQLPWWYVYHFFSQEILNSTVCVDMLIGSPWEVSH